jgi:hypothetical protein
MNLIIRIILILLLSSTIAQGQLIHPADSNNVLVPKNEFKSIIQTFIEYNALQRIHKETTAQLPIFERIITDKDSIIALRENDIDLLKEKLKDISPAFWNNFIFGFASGIAILTAIILLIR